MRRRTIPLLSTPTQPPLRYALHRFIYGRTGTRHAVPESFPPFSLPPRFFDSCLFYPFFPCNILLRMSFHFKVPSGRDPPRSSRSIFLPYVNLFRAHPAHVPVGHLQTLATFPSPCLVPRLITIGILLDGMDPSSVPIWHPGISDSKKTFSRPIGPLLPILYVLTPRRARARHASPNVSMRVLSTLNYC